ncbi:MAG TPA: alpha/beta fold hydrolase [Magnetospirillaceae bacterium]|jgi:pimeloyl-ACP methyl ester carboxylesterase
MVETQTQSEPVAIADQIVGEGTPLLILHGLFGSGRNWGGIARTLAHEGRQVHLLDARNHGGSPWGASMTYPEMAADVAAHIEKLGRGAVDVIGHSMGGKASMTLALTRPDLVKRLVVVDIAPVTYRGGAQEPYGAYIDAMKSLDLGAIKRRAEADAQLAGAITDASMRAFLVQNLESGETGYHWRINLDGIAANLPALTSFPEIDAQYDGPMTVLAGELSNYVRPRDEATIMKFFPQAKIVVVDGAGHWPHADQPERLLALLREALAR